MLRHHYRVKKQGEDSPEVADLYLAYGKALLENAISQTAVLGKQQTDNGLIKDEPDVGGTVITHDILKYVANIKMWLNLFVHISFNRWI